MAKKLSAAKAKEILRDGTAQGHPLTDKQKRFFGARAGSQKPKFQHSPDRYESDAVKSVEPPRNEYHRQPENLNTSETPKKAGTSRGKIQESDGTASPRAESRTKSAAMPDAKAGGSKIPGGVQSYDDTKGERD